MSHTSLGIASTLMLVCGAVCTDICSEAVQKQRVILDFCTLKQNDITDENIK